jgi:phosphate:Na+ symporter
MHVTIFQLLGGIGLFLLGMVLLTDGLKAFAGQALQQALVRFTGTPAKAFASSALATLMVQSSSATTVTLIGFVSAGLIAFPQAVGAVIGASLGTTGTGWLVSVLGLKVSLGTYALPAVGIGALMRLLAHGRRRSLGLALAGFGLIFIGIETLQTGMQILVGTFGRESLPATLPFGFLVVAMVGILMTVVMQSSSAAVATTLTALHTQAVSFDQAAVLVIGASIGTTVTGALAVIGGSVPAKRTALAHVLFNLATGLIAIFLLPLLLWVVELAQRHGGLEPGAVSLAAFHTLFIGLGVAAFLPFARPLAHWIERVLPDRGLGLTRHLDDSLLEAPAVGLEATRRTLTETSLEIINILEWQLQSGCNFYDAAQHAGVVAAIEQTQRFFTRIPTISEDEPLSKSRIGQLHAIDHLTSLVPRLSVPTPIHQALAEGAMRPAIEHCRQVLGLARLRLLDQAGASWRADIEMGVLTFKEIRHRRRIDILQQTAIGTHSPAEAMQSLDAMRWLVGVAHHMWRVSYYLTVENGSDQTEGKIDENFEDQ